MKNKDILVQDSKNSNRKQRILNVAGMLFLTQGYGNTSMRQIAAAADVSLGLVTYHFSVKSEIAFALLKHQLGVFKYYINKYVNMNEDPVLYSAVLIKLNCRVMSSPKFSNFYMDMLKNDIYLEVMIKSGIETFVAIDRKYDLGLETDYMRLYGNYISMGTERTLTLYAQDYNLSESIPDLVFKTYMVYFINDMKTLNGFCKKSETVVRQILKETPELCDLGFLLEDMQV